MIEVRVIRYESGVAQPILCVDGVKNEEAIISESDSEQGGYRVILVPDALSATFLTRRISEFADNIESTIIYANLHLIQDDSLISQYLAVYKYETGKTDIAFIFLYDAENWNRLWSVREYKEAFKLVVEQQNLPGVRWLEKESVSGELVIPGAVKLLFPVHHTEATIEAEAQSRSEVLNQLHQLTEASLTAKLHQESVVMNFDFPEEVRVPCEQYLLYFVQFLKDLGVEATAELQHQAGQVLFAVTPTNKEEALDNIREALGDYLKLAASPVNPGSVLGSEIEVQRLAANIQHLQGQLTLAHAVLQAKDATIQLQQTTINHQQRILSGEVIFESLRDVTPRPKGEDREEVLDGTVAITPLKGKGFEIGLPEIYRRIKRRFKREV